MFKKIHIQEWRQFADLEIEFHNRLTVLTGANGAGKTTILNLLSNSIGWGSQFVSSFEMDKIGQRHYYNSFNNKKNQYKDLKDVDVSILGRLEFDDDTFANLVIPQEITTGTYEVLIHKHAPIKGVYINSHRHNFPYKILSNIPTEVDTRENIYQKMYEFNQTIMFDWYRDVDKMSITLLIKQALASLAIFGYGNNAVVPNDRAKKLFEGYVNILRKTLPSSLGFKEIKVAIPEVILCTESGNFPIDAVSGGISSIIEITWQLYMFADETEHFVAMIDEPENHLHPELQKSFLRNLISAFPNVQFIIATHNPFMISAVKDSNVYVLNYNSRHKVFAKKLDYVNKAGTSNAILREVLGIDTSLPVWAEDEIKVIIDKYISKEITQENLTNLRKDLETIGLADFIPETIAKIVEGKTND